MLHRKQESRLARNEHDDEIGRFGPRPVEQRLIALAAQLVDMSAHRAQMILHGTRGFLGRRALGIGHVSRQRNLRVDDDPLALGQLQDHVGTQVVALLVLQVVLRLVVDALGQMRTVENRLEKHLAPVALHFRVAFQRAGQVVGLLGHAQVRLAEPTNFRFE